MGFKERLHDVGSFRMRILALADEFEGLERRCAELEGGMRLSRLRKDLEELPHFEDDDPPSPSPLEPSASSIGIIAGQAIVVNQGPSTATTTPESEHAQAMDNGDAGTVPAQRFSTGEIGPVSEPPDYASSKHVYNSSRHLAGNELNNSQPPGEFASNGRGIQQDEAIRHPPSPSPSAYMASSLASEGEEAQADPQVLEAPSALPRGNSAAKSMSFMVGALPSEPMSPQMTSRGRASGSTRRKIARPTTPSLGRVVSERAVGGEGGDTRVRFDRRFLDALPEEDQHRRSEFAGREDGDIPESFVKQKTPFGVLSPVGSTRLSWDGLASAVLLFDTWVTLFELVYLVDHGTGGPLNAVHWSIVAFFALDLVLNFCTGYITEDKIVMSRKKSVSKYLRGWFWVDFIATFPLDMIISGIWEGSGAVSLVRFGKVARVLRTLRFLRMMRSHSSLRQARGKRQQIYDFLAPCISLAQLLAFSLLLAHIDGCLRGIVQLNIGTLIRAESMQQALENYWENFLWSFLELAAGDAESGNTQASGTPIQESEFLRLRAFSMLVAAQRLALLALLALWAVTTGSRFFAQNDAFRSMKAATLSYLQKRKVGIETQLQIVYFMNQAHKAHVTQTRFQIFTSQHLPEELRRAVCEELWASKLLSLGLILHVTPWHDDLLNRLALIVREDVLAAKMVLCREGSPGIAAYHIIKGKFVCMGKFSHFPPFTEGMWVGERALVSTLLHRKMTVIAMTMSCTMTVPAEEFHQILQALELTQQYQDFCVEHLPKGLCGRCGTIGEHMVLGCPTIRKNTARRAPTINLSRQRLKGWGAFTSLWPAAAKPPERPFGRHRLRMATQDISAASVLEGEEIANAAAIDGPQMDEHLLFLSHYKAEAGTEAALIRTEIEHLLGEDIGSLGHYFESPVFLDSEDLTNLEELQEKVRLSHNLLLLLSKDVLSRPWVLIEICTALQAGTRILPVTLVKNEKFEIPDETFYERLRSGSVTGPAGKDLLEQHGVSLEHVEASLRLVFKRIAMPYSPHRAASIRRAELTAILKICRLKQQDIPESEP